MALYSISDTHHGLQRPSCRRFQEESTIKAVRTGKDFIRLGTSWVSLKWGLVSSDKKGARGAPRKTMLDSLCGFPALYEVLSPSSHYD